MKKIISLLAALTALLFTAGCAKEIIVAEILQTPEQARIYTQYNIWYEDPSEISSLNIQKGSMIPFGTEVRIEKSTTDEITFTEVDTGRTFTIQYDPQYRMLTPEDYVRELFSTQNIDDLTAGIRSLTVEKLKRGIVEVGMTKQEVLLAFGPPCAFRTRSVSLDTWCYWTDFIVGKRIIFTNGQVSDIIVL